MTTQYIIITAILFIPALALTFHIYHHDIRPIFIPKPEIHSIATEYIKKHGNNAYDKAHINERRAWHQAQTFEQAKWRRVGKAIRKRQPHLYG